MTLYLIIGVCIVSCYNSCPILCIIKNGSKCWLWLTSGPPLINIFTCSTKYLLQRVHLQFRIQLLLQLSKLIEQTINLIRLCTDLMDATCKLYRKQYQEYFQQQHQKQEKPWSTPNRQTESCLNHMECVSSPAKTVTRRIWRMNT